MPSVVPRTKIDLVRSARIEKALHLGAGLFVGLGGALAEFMNAAMDIGAVHFVKFHDSVDDRARFLRGGGVIEIDKRLAVDGLLEDGEILADLLDIESGTDRANYRAHGISRIACAQANREVTES